MDDRTPPGEREVFHLLASGPDDWVALHALDLAPWNRGLRTEIDFIVIAPEAGILCIEVKSHENLGFDGERWFPDTIKRSPFKQAADGRFALHRGLAEIAPHLKGIPVVHACIFPRSPFDMPPNLSVQPWEVMDMRMIRTFPDGGSFCRALKSMIGRSIDADARLLPLKQRMSADQIGSIVKSCVPIRKRQPDAREEIRRREEEIDKVLRDQQKPVLRLSSCNERLIVTGGAGTGKTLIAMEVARREAERGRRVALLCFNQLVGDWMERAMLKGGPPLPNLIVGRAIKVMASLTGTAIPAEPAAGFWETELPLRLEERLTDPDFRLDACFDFMVVDEAQDLLARPRIWSCLMEFLHGGAEKGSFALLGDFRNQVLSARSVMDGMLRELEDEARPVRWHLDENCRNYRIVGNTAVLLAGMGGCVYSAYLRTGGGVHNYGIHYFEGDVDQLEQLRRWIGEFKAQGYRSSEITLLSFRADHASAGARLQAAGHKILPARLAGDAMSYASIHSFKGMENKVIILTDMALDDRDMQRDLFYTAMTRATECVRILCAKESQTILLQWMTGGTLL
ncbi:MAG: NERD domain-containing protein [Akkermansiaceae bacterium]|nr:NERD domain-containing protein [Akkermansiaceae bacterium]